MARQSEAHPQYILLSKSQLKGQHRNLTGFPLPRLRLERKMVGGEDCLKAESASSTADTQMLR